METGQGDPDIICGSDEGATPVSSFGKGRAASGMNVSDTPDAEAEGQNVPREAEREP